MIAKTILNGNQNATLVLRSYRIPIGSSHSKKSTFHEKRRFGYDSIARFFKLISTKPPAVLFLEILRKTRRYGRFNMQDFFGFMYWTHYSRLEKCQESRFSMLYWYPEKTKTGSIAQSILTARSVFPGTWKKYSYTF